MINKKLFQDYNKLETKIRELAAQKAELGTQLVNEMSKEELETVKADFGTFSLIRRVSYSFPEEVEEKIKSFKEKIKKVEETAIKEGRAKTTTSESLRFQPKKND